MCGPGGVNLDAGISRIFKFRERYTNQFRAEGFNATNTPHFANPNANVSNLVLNPNFRFSLRVSFRGRKIWRLSGV
jgi:hypothetical protein